MLPKKNRLTAAFFRTRKQPVISFVCGNISVRAYLPQTNVFRCAVVVPVKTAKKAVVRNQIRRSLYGALQQNILTLPVYDVVFFVSGIDAIKGNTTAAIQKLLLRDKK